jgi:hypothetical protein
LGAFWRFIELSSRRGRERDENLIIAADAWRSSGLRVDGRIARHE